MGKSFRSAVDRPVVVSIPGRGETISLEPGDSYEAQSEAEEEALAANPDLEQGKAKSKSDEKKKKG